MACLFIHKKIGKQTLLQFSSLDVSAGNMLRATNSSATGRFLALLIEDADNGREMLYKANYSLAFMSVGRPHRMAWRSDF
jgi:hypothetical protein